MWHFERLNQEAQNRIIELWQDDQLIKIVEILNENKVTNAPLSQCCGREHIIKWIEYGINTGLIKKEGRKV